MERNTAHRLREERERERESGRDVGVLFEMCLFEGPSECCRGFVGCAIPSFNRGRVCVLVSAHQVTKTDLLEKVWDSIVSVQHILKDTGTHKHV